jgi:uncharacterized membrane protein required for colicin V production
LLAPADIAVLVLMAITAVIGFWTGFIWQVIRLVSVIASVWIALVYCPVVAGFMGSRLPAAMRDLVSAAAVFLAAMLVLYLVGYLFRDVVNALKPQVTDRILGAVFGTLLGAIIAAFFAFAVLEYAEEDGSLAVKVQRSAIAGSMGRFLGHALPDSVRKVVDEAEGAESPPAPERPTEAGPGAAPQPPQGA